MLVLLFHLGEGMYAVDCRYVKEISPMVRLKTMPHSPGHLAGLFHYRGSIVPVLDLGTLILGAPCRVRLSSRIIIIEMAGESQEPALFGLIAERVTEAVRKPAQSFVSPGIHLPRTPYLGGVLMEQEMMIQLIDLEALSRTT